jgi:hypothetical protein
MGHPARRFEIAPGQGIEGGDMGRGGSSSQGGGKRRAREAAASSSAARSFPLDAPASTESSKPEPLQPVIAPEVAARFWPFAAICATACVSLGLVQFVGDQSVYLQMFPLKLRNPDWVLGYRAWWVMLTVMGFWYCRRR